MRDKFAIVYYTCMEHTSGERQAYRYFTQMKSRSTWGMETDDWRIVIISTLVIGDTE